MHLIGVLLSFNTGKSGRLSAAVGLRIHFGLGYSQLYSTSLVNTIQTLNYEALAYMQLRLFELIDFKNLL